MKVCMPFYKKFINSLPSVMLKTALQTGNSGDSTIILCPSSHALATFGSNGNEPRKGTLNSSANDWAPPVVGGNIRVSTYRQKNPKFNQFIYVKVTFIRVFKTQIEHINNLLLFNPTFGESYSK